MNGQFFSILEKIVCKHSYQYGKIFHFYLYSKKLRVSIFYGMNKQLD